MDISGDKIKLNAELLIYLDDYDLIQQKKKTERLFPSDGDWSDYWESSTITQQSADSESKNPFLCYLMMFPGCENTSFTPFPAGFLVIFRLEQLDVGPSRRS